MTASQVTGFGHQKAQTEIYRGSEYTVDFIPKIKLEIVVANEILEKAIKTIQETAKTGKIGDGKIFVWAIDKAVRIRTAEVNESAV